MTIVSIEDDHGIFTSCEVGNDIQTVAEAALICLDELIEWFDPESNDIYSDDICILEQSVLKELKVSITLGHIEVIDGWLDCQGFYGCVVHQHNRIIVISDSYENNVHFKNAISELQTLKMCSGQDAIELMLSYEEHISFIGTMEIVGIPFTIKE